MATEEPSVKSARRVLELLELFVAHGQPLSLTEISDALGIPKSSAHGLLQTLVAGGFVTRTSASQYHFGTKWLALMRAAIESKAHPDAANLREAAYPVMVELARELRITCNLAVLHARDVVYIDKVQDRSNPIQISTHIGASLPAHATALGKVLVAELPAEDREHWLDTHDFRALTPHTRRSAADLRQDLALYRQRGYAIDDQESYEGVVCVATAIHDPGEHVTAAMSLTAFRGQIEEAGRDRIGARLCEAAGVISAALADHR